MTQKSHDHNFKNLFLDFPKETLDLFLPEAEQKWGEIQKIEFVRQEPAKHKLSDQSLALDMPILFYFKNHQLLLWLVEFQEDKSKFSIYKLLRYTIDMMESHPKALVIPTVLFTDRTKWRKEVVRKLETKLNGRLLLHFEYIFFKLFDFNAHDYYNINNPVVKILLPKMNYNKDERLEVIRQAYSGLFQLSSRMLFDKYVDFIDVYAQISEQEQEHLYNEIIQHKETAMLAQYIRDKGIQQGILQGMQEGIQRGMQEGMQEGIQRGMQEGMQEGIQQGIQRGMLLDAQNMLIEVLNERFDMTSDELLQRIKQINSHERVKELFKQALRVKSIAEFGKKI